MFRSPTEAGACGLATPRGTGCAICPRRRLSSRTATAKYTPVDADRHDGTHNEAMDDVVIRDESIRLGQFLKLANLIETGADAKAVLADGLVTVNDELETRRGRQLRDGDVVELGGIRVRVASELA